MSDAIKFLIAPWGNPQGWKSVRYVIEGKEYVSKTSTLPLLEYVKPNVLIIIALDTLAQSFGFKPKDIRGYQDIRQKVEEEIERQLDQFTDEFIEKSRENGININENVIRSVVKNRKIVIAPGTGVFYPYRFEGSMTDFYNVVLYELPKIVLEHLTPESTVELHLDLTHGINYMPTLTYRAVTQLASILALTHSAKHNGEKHSVKLCVYNSEPYPIGGGEKVQGEKVQAELNIHVVEKRDVVPEVLIQWPSGDRGPEKCLRAWRGLREEEIEKIFKEKVKPCLDKYVHIDLGCGLRVNLDTLCPVFTLSIGYGLPLLLLYTWMLLARNNSLENVIEKIYNLWLENISVETSGNGILITRKLSFTELFTSYLSTWFAHKVLTDVMSHIDVSPPSCNDNVVFLTRWSNVEELYEKLYRKISPRLEIFMSNDIHEFEEYVGTFIEDCMKVLYCRVDQIISYKDIVRLIKRDVKIGGIEKRNFIAHSGLLYQLVAVRISSNIKDTEIGYYNKIIDVDNKSIKLTKLLEDLAKSV